MSFEETSFPGLKVFTPKVFSDSRGYFFESYNHNHFLESGINCSFVQDNESFSEYGTIRGLHLQKPPFEQAKLVRTIKGEVLDVVVDLRKDSPTFKQSYQVVLSEENKKQLFIPKGFAHGFAVLSDAAIFAYKCDQFYSPEHELGIHYLDNTLCIDWSLPKEDHIVSSKDLNLPPFLELLDKL